jgi:hypothetical protein
LFGGDFMILLLAPLLTLSAPAAGSTGREIAGQDTVGTPAATDPAAPAKPKKERKICRDDDRPASHIGKRICKTAAEWREAGDMPGKETIIPGKRVGG